ncbi:MAG: hypothetical protein VKK97_10045, partial [Synechococcaceae cyanobacterium]|nr:hypothetical protein [Synechococcaceae cyanobacterium]
RLGDEPEKNPGLLFLWFLADIANQFKFMLSRWALAADVLRVATGPDPLVGQPQGQQKGPLRWNGTETRDYGFKLWGLLKGGEYLFAPRISFLCSLAA